MGRNTAHPHMEGETNVQQGEACPALVPMRPLALRYPAVVLKGRRFGLGLKGKNREDHRRYIHWFNRTSEPY